MKDKLNEILKNGCAKIENATDVKALEDIRVSLLGKAGALTQILRGMKDVPSEDRREIGALANSVKTQLESKLAEKSEQLLQAEMIEKLQKSPKIDITLPSEVCSGSLHPRTIVQRQIEEIFTSMGFVVEDGNEVETEYNNFTAVNVPENHPARDMQDTFWLSNGQVLKTHTSAAQNRILKKYHLPIRAIFPGRCFRNEELDAGHENTFFQLEGVIVDENVSVGNLIYFMKEMLSKIFKKEVEIRLRPGFFPFTEPSFEMDVRCPFCDGKGCSTCKNGGWIELCPCGMIHPQVLRNGGIDPEKYSGCAFGLGLDRMTMMSFGINDIRQLNSGDLKLLKQFGLGE